MHTILQSSVTLLCHGILLRLMLLLVWQPVGVVPDTDICADISYYNFVRASLERSC